MPGCGDLQQDFLVRHPANKEEGLFFLQTVKNFESSTTKSYCSKMGSGDFCITAGC